MSKRILKNYEWIDDAILGVYEHQRDGSSYIEIEIEPGDIQATRLFLSQEELLMLAKKLEEPKEIKND